ncbi:hypothetical protein [Nonomuraea sp. SBT364]|uniref:hypothetical protein n=1 Tax=Nonomuraea sp. SBT364 TaxID=1580530 RepID=UPI000AD74ADD|nr:hypothetical protein [Nonomuraea sp. SBT364]
MESIKLLGDKLVARLVSKGQPARNCWYEGVACRYRYCCADTPATICTAHKEYC